ncbi:MAG: hypothetical protein IJH37_00905 [Clostridia bacterium]|nr:hypothetical protein [Clostridia bacterium]
MIRISNIKYPPIKPESEIFEYVAARYKLNIKSFRIHRKSVDARKKNDIHYVYTVDVGTDNDALALKRIKGAAKINDKKYRLPVGTPPEKPVVIAGFGPAGMMCAHSLVKMGARVIVLERGADVDTRIGDVERFRAHGELDPESNVQFGEGGAGTFSDGKLTTGVNDERIAYILEQFVIHGAPEEITYRAKPHVGTDNLIEMVKAFREDIISRGGEVRFKTKLTGIVTKDCFVTAARVEDENGEYEIETDSIVIACGHSARDTFRMLQRAGAKMERKPFSVGVRIEHRQHTINTAQYGDMHEFLPPADYKLSVKTSTGRSAYTFCMCPGGEVIASASEYGGIVTNGMSRFARDGENANSALLVNVMPDDLDSEDALAGAELQRDIEQAAYELCGGYRAPCMSVGAFMGAMEQKATVSPTYRPGVMFCDFTGIFPRYVIDTLREAIPMLGRKLRGFDDPGAVMTAPETRSSSPVRIVRDEAYNSSIRGLYPCGEGAGYAGGIMTAAADGIKVAEAIMRELSDE